MSEEAVDRPDLPDEIKGLADACPPKHVAVVQAVLSGDYPSNTKAYQSVYPESSDDSAAASVARLLGTDRVSALYKALRDHQLLSRALTRAEAIDILSDMARTSLGALVDFGSRHVGTDDDGRDIVQAVWSFKDSSALTEGELRSIAELNATKDGLKIKQHDPKAAIKQLTDLMGWDAPKHVKIDGTLRRADADMTEEEARLLYEANLKGLRDDG